MKIWLLKARNEELPENDNPWEPWFDKSFGHVIIADNEEDARLLAHKEAGDENRGEFLSRVIANTNSPWLDKKYTTCIELTSEYGEGVILTDFARA